MSKVSDSIYIIQHGDMFERLQAPHYEKQSTYFKTIAKLNHEDCSLIRFSKKFNKFYYANRGFASGQNKLVTNEDIIEKCEELLGLKFKEIALSGEEAAKIISETKFTDMQWNALMTLLKHARGDQNGI